MRAITIASNGSKGKNKVIFIDGNSLVRFVAKDMKVDGIKSDLGKDTRKDRRYTESGVEKAGDKSGKHSGNYGNEHCRPGRPAHDDEHYGHCRAGCERTVNGKVGKLQKPVRNVQAKSHYPPNCALGNIARKCV